MKLEFKKAAFDELEGFSDAILAYLMPKATKKKVNGSIDVCHNYAAATLIEAGRDEDLFVAMDKLVQAELSKN